MGRDAGLAVVEVGTPVGADFGLPDVMRKSGASRDVRSIGLSHALMVTVRMRTIPEITLAHAVNSPMTATVGVHSGCSGRAHRVLDGYQ